MTEPVWAQFAAQRSAGDVVDGTVVGIKPFGAFIDVDGAIGLVPQPHWLGEPRQGDAVTVRILAIDPATRRFSAEMV